VGKVETTLRTQKINAKRGKTVEQAASDLESAISWLKKEVSSHEFGEVGLRLILHSGRITRIESTTVRKEATKHDMANETTLPKQRPDSVTE
jgi:hypothetical protein